MGVGFALSPDPSQNNIIILRAKFKDVSYFTVKLKSVMDGG